MANSNSFSTNPTALSSPIVLSGLAVTGLVGFLCGVLWTNQGRRGLNFFSSKKARNSKKEARRRSKKRAHSKKPSKKNNKSNKSSPISDDKKDQENSSKSSQSNSPEPGKTILELDDKDLAEEGDDDYVYSGTPSSTASSDDDYEDEDDSEDDYSDLEDPRYDASPGAFAFTQEQCKMVLVIRTDLHMTKGKIAAQCAHAALACFKSIQRSNPEILARWERFGQAKITLQVKSEEELQLLQAKAVSLDVTARLVRDAGRTQIAAGSATVLGLGPAPISVIDKITGGLKLY